MITETKKVWEIICDNCGDATFELSEDEQMLNNDICHTEADVKADARRAGWKLSKFGDFCPACLLVME